MPPWLPNILLLQVFDVGESRGIPMEFPEEVSGFGAWRTFVMAAGMADAVSRTVTAPIDRLKTQLQVRNGAEVFIQVHPGFSTPKHLFCLILDKWQQRGSCSTDPSVTLEPTN